MCNKVLYIILRTDLKWKAGPLVAQGSHAVSLLVHKYHKEMEDYLKLEYAMRKVVLGVVLDEFVELKEKMQEDGIQFVEWKEQPENVPTAIAIIPIDPKQRPDYLMKLKLFK